VSVIEGSIPCHPLNQITHLLTGAGMTLRLAASLRKKIMRLLTVRLLVSLVLCACALFSQAETMVAVKSGSWVHSETWNCKRMPKRTDSIIIPQGIIVSVTNPLNLAGSLDGKPMVICIAGTLSIANASMYIDLIDRIMIMPGGKISTKTQGGMIFSGDYALYFEGGTTARGPATLGDGFSSMVVSGLIAETEAEGMNLSWRSGKEIEVNYYYVMRSVDGINFEQIGKVDGRGSKREKVYSFVDKRPPSGPVHYRIDLTNMNGVGGPAAKLEITIGEKVNIVTSSSEATPGHK
jgi:hypothetical protein